MPHCRPNPRAACPLRASAGERVPYNRTRYDSPWPLPRPHCRGSHTLPLKKTGATMTEREETDAQATSYMPASEKLKGMNSAYAAIAQIYLAMFRVNVKNDTYYAIKNTDAIRQFEDPESVRFTENLRRVVRGLATEDSYENAMEFLDLSTLPARMKTSPHLTTSFTGKVAGKCELHFLKESEDAEGNPSHVIFAVEVTEDDVYDSVLDVLARKFQNVFWIDLAKGEAKILKLDGYITQGLDRNDHQYFPYPVVLSNYVNDRVHPDDRETLAAALCVEHLREVFASRQEYVGNYRVLVDGEVHNYQYDYYKMLSGDYCVCGFQNIDAIIEETVARERTEREKETAYKKKLEEQVALLNNLTRSFRNVYVANVVKGTARILKLGEDYDAEVVTQMVGKTFPYEAVLSQWIDQRVVPEDRARMRKALSTETVREALKTQEEYVGSYRSYDLNHICNYQFSVSKVDEAGNVLLGFQIVDSIIEEHLAEERRQREKEEAFQRQLIAAKDEANRANEAKTEFLLRMSHDIRTPLNGIIGMLDIAERFPDDLERQTDCREKIRESSKILLELINEVLDMSKLESGEIVLEHVPFDIREVSRDVYYSIYKQAEERDVAIVEECCETPHPWLLGSPTHLKRLMMNIISNAIKYNKEHGKVFVTCREVSCEGGVASIQLKFQDTGIGMSEEFQKHLFEPFAQENAGSRSKYPGTGLGMSIAKSIVEKMGGTIEFESVKGEGTTFDIHVPLEVTEAPAGTEAVEVAAEASICGMNVLLVEDNDLNMEIANFVLCEAGANVAQAMNGAEAVEAFEHSELGHFDAILMDVMMPVMDGYAATRTIRGLARADAKSVPIIAMTANAFAEDKIAAREAGMNEHVSKPLDTELLVQTIARLVAAREG